MTAKQIRLTKAGSTSTHTCLTYLYKHPEGCLCARESHRCEQQYGPLALESELI